MNLALFDLDGTLLQGDSDHAFGEFLIGLGWADATRHRQGNDAFYADYLAGKLDIHAYTAFSTAPWRDRPPDELREVMARFLHEVAGPALPPRAHELVQRHREAGDVLAVVTATNDFITRPIAALLGVPTLIATDLARDAHDRVSGEIAGVPAYREGKVHRVNDWLAAQGLTLGDFGRVTFYSDSINDLPLLETVSHPVATNPGAALQAIAEQRGWPILRLFE